MQSLSHAPVGGYGWKGSSAAGVCGTGRSTSLLISLPVVRVDVKVSEALLP
jgi:hypothetical protein